MLHIEFLQNVEKFYEPMVQFLVQVPISITVLTLFFLPFIPIPTPHEFIITPIVQAHEIAERHDILVVLTISVVLGEIAWHITLFFITKYNLHKLTGRKKALSANHWFHKFGVVGFLVVPTIGIAVPYFSDAIVILMGHYRLHSIRVIPYIAGGFILRGIIGFTGLKVLLGL